MSLAPRKRTRATTVSPDSVEQATVFLQELPEKPKEDLSLREAVGQMQDSLKAALAKGYSYDELAKILAEQGIQISAFTLKNYVPSGKRSPNKGKPRKAKTTQDDATVIASVEEEEIEQESEPAKATKGRRATSKATPAKPTTTRGRKRS
jgi:transposase